MEDCLKRVEKLSSEKNLLLRHVNRIMSTAKNTMGIIVFR